MKEYMEEHYTAFEQNMALSWASANFSDWLRKHPSASIEEREKQFYDCVEGGLSIALEFRKKNP